MSNIIVALDNMRFEAAERLAQRLAGKVWGFKVNDLLYCSQYWSPRLNRYGKLMFDPKLYDIPNTVKNCMGHFVACGADFVTVHASGGPAVLRAAVEAAGDKTKIVAVTALTSYTDEDLLNIYGSSRQELVGKLALVAENCGCHGLVCATGDLEWVKERKLFKICPGIRKEKLAGDDQVHTGLGAGADYIVVGRPITQAEDPLKAVEEFQ